MHPFILSDCYCLAGKGLSVWQENGDVGSAEHSPFNFLIHRACESSVSNLEVILATLPKILDSLRGD
jgi:hypothetical protein